MHRFDDPWYVWLWRDWLEGLRDWPLGTLVGIFFAVLVLGVAFALLYGLYRLADQAFVPRQNGLGRIAGKWIREGYWGSEAYTEFGMHWENGKYVYGPYTATRPKWVPPQPVVQVELLEEKGCTSEFEVGGDDYDAATEGEQILVSFQRGRFSDDVYIRSYTQAA